MARRYAASPTVAAFSVINEPSNAIPAGALCAFYRAAAGAIRSAGMRAGRVTLLFPAYQRALAELAAEGFPGVPPPPPPPPSSRSD